ncbi:tetratricopeptide repeat protein [Streptomyces sp. ACA25]|uniref:tetratricopeptide repeat protein n=1 Tax=Streptomyces sp. ACA25 TaxID=3022596 RepID=UPI0023070640|nr:tetratricopeptide repeat protein [Streptomyces sp. ACA25]MDB1089126.1 tetratricopeptide repeat protein [Streptomyces sp. ACA25]
MTEQAVHSSGAAQGLDSPDAAGFLGRRRELAALRADIGRSGLDTLAGRPAARSRVLLVAGRPGTGRTALAEEFARQRTVTGEYPDGVLRARLTDPGGAPVPVERAARDLLGALGAVAPAGAADDELTEALRAALAERRALLLLDDISTPEQLVELVPDNRDCLVLAVARGPLTGVPDVRPCTVGSLDQPSAIRLLARGAGPVRVTVDPRATESLAAACAHLPAALVLAGGWLTAHPDAAVADAAKRLADPPADGMEGAEEPLALAFRLAHSALPLPAARMLRLLTLAPAGRADAQTAAALAGCSVAAARDLLRDFARLGLLRTVSSARPAAGVLREEICGGPQYLVPGCLDPFLRRLLNDRERPAEVLLARARMLERVVRQLRSCRAVTEPLGSPARNWLAGLPGSLRFEGRGAAAGWLESRLPALLAAARLAVADGELDTLARRLIAALTAALVAHRGPEAAAPELYRLHELVLGVAERQKLPRERAAALLNLGDLDSRTGRVPGALERYRSALAAARSEGEQADPVAVGRALESIGGTYAELGDWKRAADWYGRALVLTQSRRDVPAQARLHGRIGAVLTFDGQWGEALVAWRAAAAAHRRLGDARAHARALAEAARVQEYAGRPEESLRTCGAALRAAEQAGDKRLQGALRLRLADGAERQGRVSEAEGHRAAARLLLRYSAAGSATLSTTDGHA